MSKELFCDVLVVGGGPGGYPAAIRAGQLGLKTILVEAGRLGGTCLIRGCIPSKAVIHAADEFDSMRHTAEGKSAFGITLNSVPELDYARMTAWKDGIVGNLSSGVSSLLKAANVQVISGWAHFSNAKTCHVQLDGEDIIIKAENIVLANGSTETEIASLPFDGENILSSRHLLDLGKRPESLGIIGAGYIGLELGIAMSKLGVKVTFIEAARTILPGYDSEMTRPVQNTLKQRGIEMYLGAKAKGASITETGVELTFEDQNAETQTLYFEKLLVSVGRLPVTQGWGLENMGVDMDGRFVKVDAQCQTSMRDVYAIGDIVGEPMLAHKATAQGEMVAEVIAGQKRAFAPVSIPAVCFTDPEIVSVGMSPAEAEATGLDTIIGRFPLAASGRALAMDAGDKRGFVRIVARASDHVILGIQAVGTNVSELSGEFSLALEMGSVLEDLAGTIHAHPTLSEATAESAMAALGHPIHISLKH